MIKVLINGCNGKMGQVVAKQIELNSGFNVIAGVDITSNAENNFPVYTSPNDIKEKPDVIIDFSIPVSALNIVKYAAENNVPIVVATTGITDEELKTIKSYSKTIPIFKSANMSYDINIMADIAAKLAKLLPESDIEIIETHHNNKIDAPSGTALLLADSINNSLDNQMIYEYDRHVKKEKRNKKEIGIHSVRGGTEVGKHSIIFYGENESFEITHSATSRVVFANGALKAAEFLTTQKPGFYSMKDLV